MMWFNPSTTSLAITLLLSSSLTSVLALPAPQAECVLLNIPCFDPIIPVTPPTIDCGYCGSWDGQDAVVRSIPSNNFKPHFEMKLSR